MKIKRQRRRYIADKNQQRWCDQTTRAQQQKMKNFRFNFYLNWDMYEFFQKLHTKY